MLTWMPTGLLWISIEAFDRAAAARADSPEGVRDATPGPPEPVEVVLPAECTGSVELGLEAFDRVWNRRMSSHKSVGAFSAWLHKIQRFRYRGGAHRTARDMPVFGGKNSRVSAWWLSESPLPGEGGG